ncbi:uncharacterized protein MONBRDRAFT_28340 [Monosiga brevicollis MX1]|uniref:Vta1/callose synthase N-terminal domain-containing protein n=1 Tax=Monosiga brevicollis TaxID=81824 RepID=A9V7W2_MONBE|nr:uncharacterized protein MONBRDRAFT_28340 [Monosiga brevicollis MX1]EDQ86375.1 predicted protein [Monosiga brevicollis MX1]|eukprot:XP_001748765.1 hypothetical protein [Monosiga brevicollis MX1]
MADLPPLPEAMKGMSRFIKTAALFEARTPAVTYYCYLFVLKNAIKNHSTDPACRPYLGGLLTHVEELKASMPDEESIRNSEKGKLLITTVATSLFDKANRADMAGEGTRNTADLFYRASTLYDIMDEFENGLEEVAEARKYAKLKAAHIVKCLREGRQPTPGPIDADGNPRTDIAPPTIGLTTESDLTANIHDAGLPPAGGSEPEWPSAAHAGPADYTSGYENNAAFPPAPSDPSAAYPAPNLPSPPAQQPSGPDGHQGFDPLFNLPAVPENIPSAQASSSPPPVPKNPGISVQPPAPAPQATTYRSAQRTASASSATSLEDIEPRLPATARTKTNISSRDIDQAKLAFKYANSALQYQDVKTAVEYCLRALTLMTE